MIESTLVYNANLSAAMAQIKSLTAQVGALNLSMNSLDAAAVKMRSDLALAFSSNIGGLGGFTTKMTQLNTAVESFGKAMATNKLTMREYFQEAYRGLTRQDSMMRQFARNQARYMESIVVPMGGAGGKQTGMVITPNEIDLKNAATRMNVLNQEFTTFRHLVRSGADEMINFGKNTQWTGRQLTVGLTMPVVLFGATFAKTFMSIDKELTRFAKVYGNDVKGTTINATEEMKQKVMDLAKAISTNFGVAATETVALAADIAATGQEGQNLLDMVSQTSRLAVLGEVDRQEAMKATLAIQTAFKQNTNELAESINFLNAIENQTSTTLNDLVEAIPKAGPVVKGLGGSIEDLSVLMVAMKEGGIPAAEAANAIKSGMASLINPTKKAADTAKEFGVNIVEIVNANKGQLMPTLFALQESLDGLDSFSRSRVIEELFGKYQFARLSALFNNLGKAGSQTEQAMKLAGASTEELAGIANQELKAYTESTTVRFQRMMETVKNQLLPVGEALLNILTPALEKISGAIEFVGNLFNKLPEPVKNFVGILGAFALVAGPILMLAGLFKQLVGNSIKFGMSIVTLGAQLAGIKVGKLEVLDAETMAAKSGVDKLTTAFATQEAAVRGLREEMERYLTALQKTAAQNPQMFAPTATTTRRAPARVLRRAAGGDVPGGYGGGDIIPALLEPGEFVMNKEATAKFGSILVAMNRGTIKGFQNGHGEGDIPGFLLGKAHAPSSESGKSPQPLRDLRDAVLMANPQLRTTLEAAREAVRAELIRLGLAAEVSAGQLGNLLQIQISHLTTDVTDAGEKIWKASDLVLDLGAINNYMNTMKTKLSNASEEYIQNLVNRISIIVEGQLDESAIRAALSGVRAGHHPKTREELSVVRALGQISLESGDLKERYQGAAAAAAAGSFLGGGYLPQSQTLEELSRSAPSARQNVMTRAQSWTESQIAQGRLTQIQSSGQRAAEQMVDAAGDGVEKGLGINSPSRVATQRMERAGESFSDGVVIGFDRGIENLSDRAAQIVVDEARQASSLILPGQGIASRGPIIDPTAMSLGPTVSTVYGPSGQPLKITGPSGPTSQVRQPVFLGMPGMAAGPDTLDQRSGGGGGAGFLGSGMLSMGLFGITGVTSTLGMFNEGLANATSGLNSFLFGLSSIVGLFEMFAFMKGSMGGAGGAAGAGGMAARFLPFLTNPVTGIAAIVIGTSIIAFMQYKKAAEEARKAAVAAFAEPTETAKFFGKELKTVEQALDEAAQRSIFLSDQMKDSLAVDPGLLEGVKTDYADLIEKIKKLSAEGAGRELAKAFNNMIIQGLSAEDARGAVVAIAREAGKESAVAYVEEFTKAKNIKQAVKSQTELLSSGSISAGLAAAEAGREDIRRQLEAMGINPDNLRRVTPETMFDPYTGYRDNGAFEANVATYGQQARDLYQNIINAQTLPANQSVGLTGKTAMDILNEAGYSSIEDARTALQSIITQANALQTEFQQAHNTVLGLISEGTTYYVDAAKAQIDSFIKAYASAPQQVVDGFMTMGTELGKITNVDLQPLKDKLLEVAPQFQPIINKVTSAEQLMQLFVAATQKIPLSKFTETKNGVLSINAALLSAVTSAQTFSDAVTNALTVVNNTLIREITKGLQAEATRIQSQIDGIIEGRDIELQAIDDASKAREISHEDEMEKIDDRIKALQKESQSIGKIADDYIKSLQRRKQAESFYSSQAQTGLGALKSLASGDIFGYLQSRAEMTQRAEEEAFDRTIQQIEERKEKEQEAIELKIEKEQDYQEELEDSYRIFQRNQEESRKQVERTAETNLQTQRTLLGEINTRIAEVQTNIEDGIDEYERIYGPKLAEPYRKAHIKALELAYTQQILAGANAYNAYENVYGRAPTAAETIKPAPLGQYRSPTGAILPSAIEVKNLTQEEKENAVAGLIAWVNSFIRGNAMGGYISGPGSGTSDSIPARLSNGEFVVRASSVAKYGVPMMNSINEGRFAMGGMVKKYKMPRYNMGGMVTDYAMGGMVGGNVYNIQVNAGNIDDPNMLADIIMRKMETEASRRNHGRRI